MNTSKSKLKVINEILLVGGRMLDAIDQRLCSIKLHVQNKRIGGHICYSLW